MDASNALSVSVSSSLAWPTCTPSGIHTMKLSTENDKSPAQAVIIKGVGLPVYQITQQDAHLLPFQLTSVPTSFSIDNVNLPVMLAPQSHQVSPNCPAQALTFNIMNPLPMLSQTGPSSLLGTGLAKAKNFGKHICAHCGRDCLKPSVLEKHIRSHTGERPFPCTICGISFKTQSNLYKHRRTQTHVNNAKQSSESDCSSCQGDQNGGCLDISKAVESIHIDKDQCQENMVGDNIFANEHNLIPFLEDKDTLISNKNQEKLIDEADYPPLIKDSTLFINQKRTLKDQWPTTTTNRHVQLQRQSETCIDKQLDSSSSQRKLKKCESTDSGYLSHSDSADLQMFSGSPLHSLSESSFESEPMLGTLDYEDKMSSSKKNLEEHISMLISQNKAVVDNTLLDNVRPRKTALSKQGSIDLPMPYTFKDSFHFDIKSLDANRKKLPATHIFTPPEKMKTPFFHSVPTQISSSIDNAILARSNSLPFVENGRVQERFPARNSKAQQAGKHSLNVSFANLLLSNTATACTVDFSSSHPRGLVRQTAVDEMPASTSAESSVPEESKELKKPETDQLTPKCKTTSRKAGQKKSNMFSHEKWQMYGDETFKKFYQKTNKSEHAKKMATSPQNCLPKMIKEEKQTFVFENIHTVSDLVVEAKESRASVCSMNAGIVDTAGPMNQDPSHVKLPHEKADGGPFSLLAQMYQSTLHSDHLETVATKRKEESSPDLSFQNNSDNIFGQLKINKTLPLERKTITAAKMEDQLMEDDSEDSIINEYGQLDHPQDNNMKILPEKEDSITYKFGQLRHSNDSNNKMAEHNDPHKGMTMKFPGDKNECEGSVSNPQSPSSPLSLVESGPAKLFSINPPLKFAQATTAQKDNLFSPRYLIKFDYIGVTSALQAEHPAQKADLFSHTTCSNFQPIVQHNSTSQIKMLQKHDSVITPFSKISLNSESVSTAAASVSIQVTQHLFVNAQGKTGQFGTLNGPCLSGQELTTLTKFKINKETIASKVHYREHIMEDETEIGSTGKCIGSQAQGPAEHLEDQGSERKSVIVITKSSQVYPWLPTTTCFQTKLSYWTTAESITSQDQEGVFNVSVTKVTFSSLNTEPKSTWCWLDKCLPLPTEQKDKLFSIYASLNSSKDRKMIHSSYPYPRSTDKPPATFAVEPPSIHWKSFKQKDCPGERKQSDSSKFQPFSKRASKMKVLRKSRLMNRIRKSTQERSNSKVPKHLIQRGFCQDQQPKITSSPSSHASGDALQRNGPFTARCDIVTDTTNAMLHSALPIDRQDGNKDETEMKNVTNKGILKNTSSTLFASFQPLMTGEKSKLLLPEEFSLQKLFQGPPFSWQKSSTHTTSNEGATSEQVTPDIKRMHLPQDLVDGPPQKHGRKLLQRSRTIGHSSSEETSGLSHALVLQGNVSLLPRLDLRAAIDSKEVACGQLQLQNSAESIAGCGHSDSITNIIMSPLESEELSVVRHLSAHSLSDALNPDQKSPTFQKKVNLEVMRKQTHVEYSDCSSDDEDRLYIEEKD